MTEVCSGSFNNESIGISSPPKRLANSAKSIGEGLSRPALIGRVEGYGSMVSIFMGAGFFLVLFVGDAVRSMRVSEGIFLSLFLGQFMTMAFYS